MGWVGVTYIEVATRVEWVGGYYIAVGTRVGWVGGHYVEHAKRFHAGIYWQLSK